MSTEPDNVVLLHLRELRTEMRRERDEARARLNAIEIGLRRSDSDISNLVLGQHHLSAEIRAFSEVIASLRESVEALARKLEDPR